MKRMNAEISIGCRKSSRIGFFLFGLNNLGEASSEFILHGNDKMSTLNSYFDNHDEVIKMNFS